MPSWVRAKICIISVFIARIGYAVKVGFTSLGEEKLKKFELTLSRLFHFFFHKRYQFFCGAVLNSLLYKGQCFYCCGIKSLFRLLPSFCFHGNK